MCCFIYSQLSDSIFCEVKIIKNSIQARFLGLIGGLLLNAFGNGLCISGNAGSGLWTASAVNLSKLTNINVGIFLFTLGILNVVTNQFLIHHWDWHRFVGEFCFIFFFSYFVNTFAQFFNYLGIPNLPFLIRALISCLGVVFFCIAISLYQRANIIMHPNDDTTNLLRFLYLKGNSTAAQLLDFVVPIVIIIFCTIFSHKIYAVNVATLFSFLLNGVIIAEADRLIFPQLKHNFKRDENY
ncbi:hypothetical protein FD15_GL000959 [Liquorilactobacillus sucicola DSM 21376 = JCM 15457]|uniref:Sugar specific permease n=1 Tax=Liquorilactobacillus sucicola DSM 21376 = JCM 15457 TaxID=1423806 RepID=A0A0R2DUP6_9LACO|nr:hypothetical protein FD15_GL000959 [Liquorilactobacillus sucicola DSM 21376 = JCM 15457]